MGKPYLSPEEASLQLGICPREIRRRMRNNEIDLGIVFPPNKAAGQKKYKFYIYQPKIDKIIGREVKNCEEAKAM